MSATSLMYYSPELELADCNEINLYYNISGSVWTPREFNHATLVTTSGFTAQSQIDDFLGTSIEFDVNAFNAASIGVDSAGIIINMAGQAKYVEGFSVFVGFSADIVSNVSASAVAALVTVVSPLHGLITADLINVFNVIGFTNPSFAEGLSISITVVDANTFTFTAPGGAPLVGPATLNYILVQTSTGLVPGVSGSTGSSAAGSTFSLGKGVSILADSARQNAVAVGEDGNIGVKIVATGLTSLLTGRGEAILKILWKPQ